jgi:hypothetical protein
VPWKDAAEINPKQSPPISSRSSTNGTYLVLLPLLLPCSIGSMMPSDHGLIGRAVLLLNRLHLIAIDRGRHRRARAVVLQGQGHGTNTTVAGRRRRRGHRGEGDVQPLPDLGHVPLGRHGHLPDGGGHAGSGGGVGPRCTCGFSHAGGQQQSVAAGFRLGLIEGEGVVGKPPAGAGAARAEGGRDAVRAVGGRRGEADGHGGVGRRCLVPIAPDGRSPAGRRVLLLLVVLLLLIVAAAMVLIVVVPGRRGGHHLRRRAGRRRNAPSSSTRLATGGGGLAGRGNPPRRTDEARFQQLHPPFEGGVAAAGGSPSRGRSRRSPLRPALLGAHPKTHRSLACLVWFGLVARFEFNARSSFGGLTCLNKRSTICAGKTNAAK